MSSVFSKIIAGDLPAFKVAEDEKHLAFLDVYPLAYGHVLVIPKKKTDYIFDINTEEYLELFRFAKHVANAMDKVIVCSRIGISVVGLEIPHTHIHLVPLNTIEDINFTKAKLKFSKIQMENIAQSIRTAI